MTGIEIRGTGHYVPEFVVSNDDFTPFIETSDEWIRTRTGMQRRHLSLGEPSWLLGAKAGKIALEDAGIAPEEVDLIVVTTASPDFCFPSLACVIQNELGAVNAFAFDISVACAGLTYSLDMARRYMATGEVKTALLIAAENLTQLVDWQDRRTCVLFADGGGACVVQQSDKPFAAYLHTDGAGGRHTYCMRSRKPVPPFAGMPEYEEQTPFPVEIEDAIYMNGREVYKFATQGMPLAVNKACEKLGIGLEDLDIIIPHQANYRILETAAKNMGISMDKIYINIHEYANTSSASIFIGLDECVRQGRIKRGDKVCIVGFGGGLTLGANIFEY